MSVGSCANVNENRAHLAIDAGKENKGAVGAAAKKVSAVEIRHFLGSPKDGPAILLQQAKNLLEQHPLTPPLPPSKPVERHPRLPLSEIALNKLTQEIGFLDVIKYLKQGDEIEACLLADRLCREDLSKLDSHGFAIAHYAVKQRAHSVLQVLKSKGVSLNVWSQGKERFFPVDLAISFYEIAERKGDEAEMREWKKTFEVMRSLGVKQGKLFFLAPHRPVKSISSQAVVFSDQKRLERNLIDLKPLVMQGAPSKIPGIEDPKKLVKKRMVLNLAAQVFKQALQ